MYEYDSVAAEESLNSANSAVTTLEPVPSDINSASSLAAAVKVDGLEFLNDSSYVDTIKIISNYPSVIITMISQAERDLIIECVQNGDMSRLVQYVNEGKISTQSLIEYSKEYMVDIMNSGNINSYNAGFAVIGGENARYSTVNSAFEAMGFSDNFIYNLSNEYCRNLINNNLMYSREGSVTMATSFTGLLAMFGLKLGYKHTEFDRSYDGFYFGTGEEGSRTFGAIDCCNYTDWLARCAGIDIYAYGPGSKYLYANDGYTPSNEYLASINDDYYKKGVGGDLLSTGEHIMMIVANDGNGYFFAEDGCFGEINYMTYQQLSNKGYRVTNTDALYRNTSKPPVNEYVWLDENGNLANGYSEKGKVNKTEVFANPYWIINQKNINLTEAEKQSLIKQYNERNKNANFTGIEFDPSLIYKTNLDKKVDSVINDFLNANSSSADINGTSPLTSHLTARMGHIDGPEAYETWYDLDMSTAVNNMEKVYGYTNVKAGIRDDGVKVISGTAPDGTTFKDLVMVAADVRHEVSNPYGTYERGQIVDTTLGKGIVVDACRLAIDKRETNQGNHFDIATAWWTGKYSEQAYSKDNNVKLTEAVNNVIYNETGEPPIISTSNEINTSNSTASSNSSVNTSKPSTSTNTPIYTSNTPNYSSGSSSSNSSSSSSSATVPSYSNDTSSSHGTSATPPIDLDTTITNILPENKFSDVLPQLSSGNLGPMEISRSSVNYDIFNVSKSTYEEYIQSLLDEGYVMSNDGSYIKGNYQVNTTMTQDGTMNIKLNII